jgi:hypothetical protein
MSQCMNCGGMMEGDGYTSVLHCEYVEEFEYEYLEPDAPPVYCDYPELKPYKVIVAGGRDFNDYALAEKVLHQAVDRLQANGYEMVIVSGMARGADRIGREYGHHFHVQVDEFPADWDTHGKRAGYLRNEQMANHADGLIAFWDGKSRGTMHMIETMKKLGKPIRIVEY